MRMKPMASCGGLLAQPTVLQAAVQQTTVLQAAVQAFRASHRLLVCVKLCNQVGCCGAVIRVLILAVLAAHGVYVRVAAACVVVPQPEGPSEGPFPGTGFPQVGAP